MIAFIFPGQASQTVGMGQALAEARGLDEIKSIRDKAEAVRKYAQSASLGLDVQNRAAEVKLRAERQAGKLLSQMVLRGGDRRSKSHRERLKLDDLGLTSNQSKRWQLQARVPEDIFREYVKQTREECRELTSAGVMRLAKRLNGESTCRNDQAVGSSEHGNNGRRFNGARLASHRSATKWDDHSPKYAIDEVVAELKNHLTLLDGILRPLYTGELMSLQPTERRMVRYLLAEIGGLFSELDGFDSSTGATVNTLSSSRTAI